MVREATLTAKKLVALDPVMVEAIRDFRFEQRIETESESIRRLIELGLASVNAILGDQLIAYCRSQGRSDLAQVIEALVFEVKNPSDKPLMHSFPRPPGDE